MNHGIQYMNLWVSFILVYIFTRKVEPFLVSALLFWLIIAALAFFSTESYFWENRYFLPHVLCNGFSGSIYERPVPVGRYFIFNTGNALFPVPVRGRIATLVIPQEKCMRIGSHYVSNCLAKPKPFGQLPEEVFIEIRNRKAQFNKKNIFFADYSEEFQFGSEKVADLQAELDKVYLQLTNARKIIEGEDDMLAGKIEAARKLSSDEGAIKKAVMWLGEKMKRKEEPEP